MEALLNTKNGQEMAKRRFAKTDARYWQEVIFKPTYVRDGKTVCLGDWGARIQWRGRRELFNLHTPNRTAAAAKAKEIYTALVGTGWDATLVKFKPEMQRKLATSVGEFLDELNSHWSGRAKTFQDYCRSFRRIVSEIFGIHGGHEKYDYVNGGRKAWLDKINKVRLADVTPEKVDKWRIAFVKRAGSNPLKQRRARISCNSLMRQAKSLFAPELLAHVAVQMPEKSPFHSVSFHRRDSMRYQSTIDIESLITAAVSELPPEQLKIFLLATMAGLRHGEIDTLPWQAFRWNEGIVRIEPTEHSALKTCESAADVPIDREVSALFRGWHAKATGHFVIEADAESRFGATYTHYRAQKHFDALMSWLRAKGITAPKPLHELRKEFGSQICDRHGIFAASRMLRHAGIGITEQHYVDQKKRVTIGLGNLLPAPKNVTPITSANGKHPALPAGKLRRKRSCRIATR
jgi:hypothetical protein